MTDKMRINEPHMKRMNSAKNRKKNIDVKKTGGYRNPNRCKLIVGRILYISTYIQIYSLFIRYS